MGIEGSRPSIRPLVTGSKSKAESEGGSDILMSHMMSSRRDGECAPKAVSTVEAQWGGFQASIRRWMSRLLQNTRRIQKLNE